MRMQQLCHLQLMLAQTCQSSACEQYHARGNAAGKWVENNLHKTPESTQTWNILDASNHGCQSGM